MVTLGCVCAALLACSTALLPAQADGAPGAASPTTVAPTTAAPTTAAPAAVSPAAVSPAAATSPAVTSAPQPVGSREDRAVDWANGQLGSDAYNFRCGEFAANAYGRTHLGYNSALEFRNHLAELGQIHPDFDYPKGALVFSMSDYDIQNGIHQGHVMISRGDGSFVSGGASQDFGTGHTVQLANSWNPSPGATYLGWAFAPADWPGP